LRPRAEARQKIENVISDGIWGKILTWIFFVALLVCWTTGVIAGDFFGGALHLLLLGAIAVLFLETLTSSRATAAFSNADEAQIKLFDSAPKAQ